MGKDEETEIAVECSVLDIRFSFGVGRSMFDVHHSSKKRRQQWTQDKPDSFRSGT
jgi:hypothetical protein